MAADPSPRCAAGGGSADCRYGFAAGARTIFPITLTYYVVGHATEEQLAAALPDGGAAARARLAAALDPGHHPSLLAAAEELAAPHPAEHFDLGLAIIVAGIAAQLPGASDRP